MTYNVFGGTLNLAQPVNQPRWNVCWSRLSLCLCLSVCLSLAAFPQYSMHLDVTLGNGTGCPLVAHCWADLQLVHGFRYCGNIHRRIQCYRPELQCKRVLINVNAIWTNLILFSQLSVMFNKNCTECKTLSGACTCPINCYWLCLVMHCALSIYPHVHLTVIWIKWYFLTFVAFIWAMTIAFRRLKVMVVGQGLG